MSREAILEDDIKVFKEYIQHYENNLSQLSSTSNESMLTNEEDEQYETK